MNLSDAIKAAIAPYLGQPLSPDTLAAIQTAARKAAIENQSGIDEMSIRIIQEQSKLFVTLTIMVDSLQTQIDALQAQVDAINATLANLIIGSDIQAWDEVLDEISALTLSASQVIGTDGSSAIAQYPLQRRAAGEVILLPYDPALSGWTVSAPVYVDPDGWKWYQPNGTGLSNANADFYQLFLALWGTAAYTIAGGKGVSAQADWNASKTLIVPDLRGRALTGAGTPTGGVTARAVGAAWGTETATLAIANLPSHNHRINVSNITASSIAGLSGSGLGIINNGNPSATSTILNVAGNRVANGDGLGAIADTGSNTPFAIASPSMGVFQLWFMNVKS